MTSVTNPHMTADEVAYAARPTYLEIERELADMFANPNIREAVGESFANNDPHAAALILTRLLERRLTRISTAPQRPAAADPQRSGGTAAGVPIETLATLAGMTS
jgi:hypothetical protein